MSDRISDLESPRDLTAIAAEITRTRIAKGFATPDHLNICPTCKQSPMMAKLMLIVTEVAEAAEELRKVVVTPEDHTIQLQKFGEEMADQIIRICDVTGALGVDIAAIVAAKMAKNAARPPRHGKAC